MKKSTFLKDFKAFIMRGNVMDMAVGVIIGGAFSKIVSSLVNDVIMPLLGLLVGEVSFADLKWVMKAATVDADGTVLTEAVTLNYGQFLQNIFDFLLIALCIFAAIRIVSNVTKRLKKQEEPKEEAPAPEPEPTKEELLLTEIRDLLRDR
ncbi:MAG: large-conductance mechanosensitive channel protein MscL [Clostridiales bacterium]|nr:large-conductance mechanosensitive channel protein MscL [Clostridiales bacterium]MDD7310539.1 large-conductance mechanosensitive channel protein MscL [Eubacteriales bacterium]MDY5346734.1 large-conductance mechanosensitive channel protein MscL [Eubacteriales bacterium]